MTLRKTEARHIASSGLETAAPEEALARMLAAQAEAVRAVAAAIPALARAAETAVKALRDGGKLAYAGAGSAGLMALADALELPGTFGIPPERTPVLFAGGAGALLHLRGGLEDDPAFARADLARAALDRGDAIVCVSASGSTPYTLAVAKGAKILGAVVIGIANAPESPLLETADIPVLLDTGAEIVAGSTRLGAGTAAKIALNAISTLIGLKLGHVYGGHMVNLAADNAKLKARALRIVADLAGADGAEAALAATGGRVKEAVLVAKGASLASAAKLLAESGGHLGPALSALNEDQFAGQKSPA